MPLWARRRPETDLTDKQSYSADVAAIERIEAVPTILEVVCRTTGMGFAAVARVTSDRWIACGVRDEIAFGLAPGGELKIETTICNEIRQTREPVIIDHVTDDPDFAGHPTPALYGFQSYISMPIILPDGSFFGTLCAIDPRPARLRNPEIIGMFRMFADLIAFHLDSQSRLERSEASLLDERSTAELREQFIAVLGHDLRNPLASISSGVNLLRRGLDPAKTERVLALMLGSVDRMAALIDNVLDLARGRLGGGLTVQRSPVDLMPVLRQVIDELQTSHPGRAIELEARLPHAIRCDRTRLTQLISNLIGNALTHGAADEPVRIRVIGDGDELRIAISNGGDPLSAAAIERLFQPFERGSVRPGQGGLGLGLYIASEIARAHGGTLRVTSDKQATCFTFTMPLDEG